MSKPLYLEFVNTGVANRFDLGDYELIEMNKRLKQYPDLFYEVLMHEVGHQDGKFKIKDLSHDMKSKTPGLFKFMFRHISAWTQVLPFYYDTKRNKVVYDISMTLAWIMVFGMSAGVFFFLRWLL